MRSLLPSDFGRRSISEEQRNAGNGKPERAVMALIDTGGSGPERGSYQRTDFHMNLQTATYQKRLTRATTVFATGATTHCA